MNTKKNIQFYLVFLSFYSFDALSKDTNYSVIDSSYIYDSNITNGNLDSDIKFSSTINLGYKKGDRFFNNHNSGLYWALASQAELNIDYDKLSNLQLSALDSYGVKYEGFEILLSYAMDF